MTDKSNKADHRPPCESERNTPPTVDSEMLERRVCPNCRAYWDAAPNAETWFCSIACQKRHEQGVFWGGEMSHV